MKHKILQDFHYLSSDKKITILKAGTVVEDYVYKYKGVDLKIDKEIIDVNKEFFSELDWRTELLIYVKKEKIAQPAVICKKLYPFIEEMFVSTTPTPVVTTVVNELSNERILELDQREFDLDRREKRISNQEEDIELRTQRIEKRESEYKNDVLNLDKKEEDLKSRLSDLIEKQNDLEIKSQELNEKERNLDLQILDAASNLDLKYGEIQSKMDFDIRELNEREKALEIKSNELNTLENSLQGQLDEIIEKREKFEETLEEFTIWENELSKLNGEIQDWENLHWKFQRNVTPPSAIT